MILHAENNAQDTTQTPVAAVASPQGPGKFRVQKKYLVVIGVLFLLVLTISIFVSQQRSTPSENSETEQKENVVEAELTVDVSNISGKVVAWLNSMRDQTGRYHHDEVCAAEQSCVKSDVDNRVGLLVMWGRFKRYEQLKNPEEFSEIIRDIDTYSNQSIVNVIQTDHWACKPLYEMWQSAVFNTEQKNKLQDMCGRSQDYVLQSTDPADTITDEVVVQDMNSIIDGGQTQGFEQLAGNPRVELIRFATSVSNYAARRSWFEQDIFYKIGLMQMKQAMFVFSNNKDATWEVAPLLGIAALDLYKGNQNKNFLDFATFIAAYKDEDPCKNLEFCMYRMALEQELYKVTGSQFYQGKATTRANQFIPISFDDETSERYRFGKGAFYNDFEETTYYVYNNGIMLGLLYSR